MQAGKAVSVQYQANNNLPAVCSLVSGVAVLCRFVLLKLTFKICGRKVIEKNAVVQVEEGRFTLRKRLLDLVFVWMYFIQIAVKVPVVQSFHFLAQNIDKRCSIYP